MDPASRTELDALRERAYGPAADILSDPDAVARLQALEDELRGPAVGADAPAAAAPVGRPPTGDGSAQPAEAERAAGRRGPRIAFVAGLAAVALAVVVFVVAPLIGGTAEPEASATPSPSIDFASRPGYERLITIALDGGFADTTTIPLTSIPVLPGLGTVRWAEPLGDYYGFDLWIGSVVTAEGERLCVAAVHAESAPAYDCKRHGEWREEGILALVPYISIAPADRPDGLDPGDSLGFWWTPDDDVLVLSGTEPAG